MPNKIVKLFAGFIVLFSSHVFCQTPETSSHPLLDKYYPQKQAPDTNKAITTQINQAPATKLAPGTKLAPVAKPVPVIQPLPETQPVAETPPTPTTATKSISETKQLHAVTDTTAINKPANIAPPAPVQKKVQSKPPGTPYMDTRLGSSSPLYDTYEKNSNGAGSVTTSPK